MTGRRRRCRPGRGQGLLAVLAGGALGLGIGMGVASVATAVEGSGIARPATDDSTGQGGASGTAAGVDAASAKRLAALRKKVLKDEDFVENDETNRDPFHSYMRIFVDPATTKNRKAPAVFDKVGLEELTLIAIVSGDETPRAMFRDASGLGQSVKKGDFLSRIGARVTKILPDRVIVETGETTAAGEARVIERAILVNPGEGP